MGLLNFSLNVTLDGRVDHREGIADDETHAFFTRPILVDEHGLLARQGIADHGPALHDRRAH